MQNSISAIHQMALNTELAALARMHRIFTIRAHSSYIYLFHTDSNGCDCNNGDDTLCYNLGVAIEYCLENEDL